MEVRGRASTIRAVTFPAADSVFAERVRQVLAELPHATRDEVVATLKRQLELVHPHVTTRFRSDLAGFGEGPVVYVFRNGTALPRFERDDWVDDPSTARVVTDAAGAYLDANDAAAALFGVPRDRIVGSRAGTFTRPDARVEDAAALWRALTTRGRLHSLAVVRSPDGTEVAVEFVTIRDGDGPARNLTVLRPVA